LIVGWLIVCIFEVGIIFTNVVETLSVFLSIAVLDESSIAIVGGGQFHGVLDGAPELLGSGHDFLGI
jgi:hypothetical protein